MEVKYKILAAALLVAALAGAVVFFVHQSRNTIRIKLGEVPAASENGRDLDMVPSDWELVDKKTDIPGDAGSAPKEADGEITAQSGSKESAGEITVEPGAAEGAVPTEQRPISKDKVRTDSGSKGAGYVENQFIFEADTEEKAKSIASAYGGKLVSFAYGIATAELLDTADHTLEELFAAGGDPEKGLPPVSPNHIYKVN